MNHEEAEVFAKELSALCNKHGVTFHGDDIVYNLRIKESRYGHGFLVHRERNKKGAWVLSEPWPG